MNVCLLKSISCQQLSKEWQDVLTAPPIHNKDSLLSVQKTEAVEIMLANVVLFFGYSISQPFSISQFLYYSSFYSPSPFYLFIPLLFLLPQNLYSLNLTQSNVYVMLSTQKSLFHSNLIGTSQYSPQFTAPKSLSDQG